VGMKGGKGEEEGTRCSCRDRVTSRERVKGGRRWGGVWTWVEGDPVRDVGDRRVGSGWVVGFKVGVGEGRVPTGGEGRAVAQVASVGLEEGLGAGTGNEAGPKVGVEESAAHKVCSTEGGGGARSSGVGDRRKKSGVFEGEEEIRKVGEGLAETRETSGREEDVKAAIVVGGGGEIEPASAVSDPGLAGERRVKGDYKLTGRVDGVGGEVEGHTIQTMVGREGRVEGPRTQMV
jgi:hypothetical protein